ncbi:hypothetical protein [Fibrobacter succinogenes]|uniref:hypothetical protein n=1 Tax=Fibrobacter succinogenes TaxID=833 RepID=UPI0013D63E2E|nr:hypothetical protein [Fibrobacter succinogenes]
MSENNQKVLSAEQNATKKANKIWLKRIRVFAGVLGMTLPWIAMLGAFIVSKAQPQIIPSDFWTELSISETYYVTPALAGVLTTAAVVLMSYKGYSLLDHVITSISGVFGIMIVLFPCNCPMVKDETLVGFFQLTAAVSNKIHCTAAVIFFLLLAFNSLFLFTKDGNDKNQELTKQKKIKNIIFRLCGVGMLCGLIMVPLPLEGIIPAKVFIAEAIALTFFGISWLVKGEVFGLLSDNKSN